MKDVAAHAGVSLKTVSRVVNGEAGVSVDVRDRVVHSIDELGFRTNLAASNLRRTNSRTGMIGALVQDISNSFSAGLLRALEDAARPYGTAVLAASLDETADREAELVHDLVTRRVDGLVIMPASHDQSYLAAELAAGLKAVFVDRPPHGVDADSVTIDNVAGARLATSHLLAQGHRRIGALLDLPDLATSAMRAAGFRDAYAALGLTPDPRLVVTGLRSADPAAGAVRAMLDLEDPPTAFFAGRNLLSVGAVRALSERGLRSSVALVGFDDFPLADLLDPPLTVVRQDVGRMGERVAKILFDRINGDTSPAKDVIFEPALIQRGSGEIPPPPPTR